MFLSLESFINFDQPKSGNAAYIDTFWNIQLTLHF